MPPASTGGFLLWGSLHSISREISKVEDEERARCKYPNEPVWVQNSDQPEVTLDQPVGGSGGGLLIGCVRHPLGVTEAPILTWLVGVAAGWNGQVGAPGPGMDLCGNAH